MELEEMDEASGSHHSETDPMLERASCSSSEDGASVMDRQVLPADGSVNIHREAHSYRGLLDAYNIQWEDPPKSSQRLRSCLREKFACSGACLKRRALKFFPFVDILRTYQWKSWIVPDLISGVSVSVIHIPQGMGFALLTSVPPVFGLYSSLFPVFLYFFFGTSRHISMGTMALISLMIGAVVDRELESLGLSSDLSNVTDTNLTALVQNTQVDIAISVSLLVGIIQFLMGLIGLGIIATFMSMPFVGSFLVGSAVQIITSQLAGLFGLSLKRRTGMFAVPLTIYDVFANITDTNVCAVVMGLICLTILIVLKEVINEKFKSKMKIPIPAEFIVVVLGTLISHFANFHERYGLKIVGEIPKGFPAPRVPPLTNASNYVGDAFLIAIISFVISITMSKLMASKHKYKIDVNQELFAYGISHGLSAFFNCFAGAQAPPRTLVHDSIGGKTQVSSLFSCVILLLVCVILGPLFQSLPICVLAAVIIIALLPLFKQFKTLPAMARVSVSDLIVYLVTFLSVVIINLTVGLALGIGISITIVIVQHIFSTGSALVPVDGSEVYVSSKGLKSSPSTAEIPGVRIFRFDSALFFINVEKFKKQLFEATVNCEKLIAAAAKQQKQQQKQQSDDVEKSPTLPSPEVTSQNAAQVVVTDEDNNTKQDLANAPPNALPDTDQTRNQQIHCIILDCSYISYVDIMGINLLKSLAKEYHDVGVRFVLAHCSASLLAKLQAADALRTSPEQVAKLDVYPLVQDAVAIATIGKVQFVSSTKL